MTLLQMLRSISPALSNLFPRNV